jgi:carboxyl-terminal processing protease
LQASPVDANKYYTPLAPIPVSSAQNIVKQELDSSEYFKATSEYIKRAKASRQKKDISLYIDDFLQEKNNKNEPPEVDDHPEKTHIFSVTNHAYEQRRIEANKDLREANVEFRENLVNDPYVKIGYSVVSAMIR